MAWKNTDNQLSKTFTFSNFQEVLEFTNKIGEVSESLKHHPTIFVCIYECET
jgi:pterin-4a-carbinolamine dehydratase